MSGGQGLEKKTQDLEGSGSCWEAGPLQNKSAVMMHTQRGADSGEALLGFGQVWLFWW